MALRHETLGLSSTIDSIAQATDALSEGLGREGGPDRRKRSRKLRSALADCAGRFNHAHEGLDFKLEDHEEPATRARLEALRATLQALLDRYPADRPEAATDDPVPS